ncbi:MAG TPA: YsnF/AvaK domain-containing protein [Allosphingosinicella sp.]|jgi:stress response protein YsnF
MSRTVTALYDTRAEAEAARERLSSTVRADSVRIIDGQSGDTSGGGLGSLHLSNDDRHAYGEGIRRGGALLCAEVDGHEDADRIVAILEESAGGVDLDNRQESWRREGWTPGANAQTSTGTATNTGARVVEEQRIPIVEEELRVGKREVERGGARVRSYVRETPVQEQVTLREEHVAVERRPVQAHATDATTAPGLGASSPSTSAGAPADLLQERTIEMREHAEEAVVQKVASVREEVVVTKTAEEHVETVQDTVRRTEVDIEGGERGEGRTAFGGFNSGSGQNTGSGDTARTDPAPSGTDRGR